MSNSDTIELGPNDQDTLTYEVDETTDVLLVAITGTDHENISTFPTWVIDGKEFPEDKRPVDEYPAKLQPLGDVLELKIRNEDSRRGTEVTVGFREKKLASA